MMMRRDCFFLNTRDDSISLKIAISALLIDNCNDLLADYKGMINQSAKKLIDSNILLTDRNTSLYNSGGAIIRLCSVLGINLEYKKNDLLQWADYWKRIYETTGIKSVNDCLSYIEYIKVMEIIDDDYDKMKIINFVNQLSYEMLNDISDMQIIYNMFTAVDSYDNKVINELVSKKNAEKISDGLYINDIDLKTTAFCVTLAIWSDFTYNREKLNQLIKNEYNALNQEASSYSKAEKLYYILAIDQIINTWNSHQHSDEQVQKVINDIMSDISASGESIVQNIETLRMVVEIVSDIQIFGSDVHLTEGQVKKIRKVVNQALKQKEIDESISVVSLKLIDSILNLSMVDDALVTSL